MLLLCHSILLHSGFNNRVVIWRGSVVLRNKLHKSSNFSDLKIRLYTLQASIKIHTFQVNILLLSSFTWYKADIVVFMHMSQHKFSKLCSIKTR